MKTKRGCTARFVVPLVAASTLLLTGGLADAATVYAEGGTGNPTASGMDRKVTSQFVPEGATFVPLDSPQDFWPVTGLTSATFDQSKDEGTAIFINAAHESPDEHVAFVAYSQSAVSAEAAAKQLQAEGRTVPLYLIGNPERNGPTVGIATLLAGLGWPGFISAVPDPAASTGPKVDICITGELICDAPLDIDPVKWGNALAGYLLDHPEYGDDLDLENATVTQVGNTIYVDIPPKSPALVRLATEVVEATGLVDVPESIEEAAGDEVQGYLDTATGAPSVEDTLASVQNPDGVQQAVNVVDAAVVVPAQDWAATQPPPVRDAVNTAITTAHDVVQDVVSGIGITLPPAER